MHFQKHLLSDTYQICLPRHSIPLYVNYVKEKTWAMKLEAYLLFRHFHSIAIPNDMVRFIENLIQRLFLVSFRLIIIIIWRLFLLWHDQGNDIDDINSERYKPDLMRGMHTYVPSCMHYKYEYTFLFCIPQQMSKIPCFKRHTNILHIWN